MASYSAAQGAHATLVASTVDIVTLSSRWDVIEVLNRDGVAEIFFSLNGSTPTVGGLDTFIVPAIAGAYLRVSAVQSPPTVKLVSSGTPKYSVEGLKS